MRKKIRRQSKKFKERAEDVKALRRSLLNDHRSCMICGSMYELACHEIAGGPLRQTFLDKPFGILILCARCNCHTVTDRAVWPQARQLALLKFLRPGWYDLEAFNWTVNPRAPNRITQDEVDVYLKEFEDGVSPPK